MKSFLKFTNELGNKIKIGAKEAPNNQVTLIMTGPKSETTDTITRKEASVVVKILKDFLSK